MAEAMARVRAELGEDALILATRRVGDGVEVTAALEPDDAPPPLAPPIPPASPRSTSTPSRTRCTPPCSRANSHTALAKAMPFATLPLGEPPLLLGRPARAPARR